MQRTAPEHAPPSLLRKIAVPLLIVIGIQLWMLLGSIYWGRNYQLLVLAAAVGIGVIPPVARRVGGWLDRIRHPSPRSRFIAAAAIFVASTAFIVIVAIAQGRALILKYHDEHSYMIQIRMLAKGRLWMPPHPIGDFFESFSLLTEPVYTSIYFPGTALLYVPALWLGLPMWLAAAMIAGGCAAMFYRVLAELVDGVAAAAGALMLLSVSVFRMVSVMLLAQGPMLLIALLTWWAWLRWRDSRRWHWAAAMGLFGGWSAIIRPLDAVILVGPVALAALVDLWPMQWRQRLTTAAAALAAAAPLLAMQLAMNLAVTGKPLETPFEEYARRYYPQTTLGFHTFDPTARPLSQLPQKHAYYDEAAVPFIKAHQWDTIVGEWLRTYLPLTFASATPQRLMMILLPVGLLGLIDRRRVAMGLGLPLFVGLYFFYTFFLPHYTLIVLPSMILLIVLAIAVMERTYPRQRRIVASAGYLAMAALCISEWPGINRLMRDDVFYPHAVLQVRESLAAIDPPAVVLFRYASGESGHDEPVYNIDVAWPDDAPIIRAHDLGERNVEIFRYYAQRDPDRVFYLYDRADHSLMRLGSATELALPTPAR